MIFGERFYPMLGRLSPWRQSLFALVLAERQLPNFQVWCELENKIPLKELYENSLKQLWEFHIDKFNHIDLEKIVDAFEKDPLLSDESRDTENLGGLYALDALLTILSACDAVILHEGDEAEVASKVSLGGVVRRIEQEGEELSEEQLRETELVDGEVNFQVDLMERLEKGRRSPELTGSLRQLARASQSSNIGIPFE